jgi:hypothetical protein
MSATTANDLERYMLDLMNEERISRGLNALVLDKVLNASADAHSLWMLENNVFSHTGVGGSTPTERMTAEGFDLSGSWRTAENIAAQSERGNEGLFDDVYDLHIALMNSPGHRANILMPDLEVVGIGIQTGTYSYDSGTYFSVMVTQNFAMTGGQTTPDTLNPHNGMTGVSVGTENATSIVGTAQDDTLTGTNGDDILSGGSGRDTAVYTNDMSNYELVISDGAIIIKDRSGRDGIDTLNSIEVLQFQNTKFELSQFTETGNLTDTELFSFIELYIAYFNRAPDALGLNYWATAYSNGRTLEEIAARFSASAETQALYPDGSSNPELITAVYNNILGRDPDQGGFEHWLSGLDSGVIPPEIFILRLLAGARGTDIDYLKNKVDIGTYFTVIKGMSNGQNGKEVMELFDGSQQSIEDAIEATDQFYTAALDPNDGEFLMPLIGVLDDPFAVA